MLDLDAQHLDDLRAVGGPVGAGQSHGPLRAVHALAGAGRSSTFRVASLTKPVTSAATALAARARGIGLDADVLDVLPGSRSSAAPGPALRIVDLLSQTSGLAPTIDSPVVAALGEGDDALGEAARLVLAAGRVRAPGERWDYYNGNYFVAGAVLAALHGTTYEQAVSELVLEPWGMTSASFVPPFALLAGTEHGEPLAPSPYPRGRRPSGGLCASVDALLVFGAGLLTDADLLAQTTRARTRPGDPMRYGLGWGLGPCGQLLVNGRLPGYRAAMVVLPGPDRVGVVLAADSAALPAAARVLDQWQRAATGDDLTTAIEAFAT